MPILQISDLHVEPEGQLAYGRANTFERLKEVCAWLQSDDAPKHDAIVVTGDVACDGNPVSYEAVRQAFGALHKPCYFLPGNHDRRSNFVKYLGGFLPTERVSDADLSYAVDVPDGTIFALDTLKAGSHHGQIKPSTLAWLEAKLAQLGTRPGFIFMHHGPVKPGMGHMDEDIENLDAFFEVIAPYDNLRIGTGHLHRAMTAFKRGKVIVSAPPTTLKIHLDLGPQGGNEFRLETPGYALHFWGEDGWVTHFGEMNIVADFAGPYSFTGVVNPTDD